MAEGDVHRADDVGRPERRKLTPRQIGAIVLAAVIVVFAVLNLQKVHIDFVVKTVSMPLVIEILVVAGIAFGAGFLFSRHREKRNQ